MGKRGTNLTHEERIKIEEGIKNNISYMRIGALLNRCIRTIKGEVLRNGGRGTYNAHKAQERADFQKNKKYQNLNPGSMLSQKYDFFDKRVKNIEDQLEIIKMHLEIILDAIKEK